MSIIRENRPFTFLFCSRPGGVRGGRTGTGTAVTQHENPYSVSSASWDLKIGERVNDTLRMSQQKIQVMVVRTFREKRKKNCKIGQTFAWGRRCAFSSFRFWLKDGSVEKDFKPNL